MKIWNIVLLAVVVLGVVGCSAPAETKEPEVPPTQHTPDDGHGHAPGEGH